MNGALDDGDLVAGATPIRALDGSGNPFYTITVEVLTFDERTDDRGPVYTGVFADATGIVELVDWFGCRICEQIKEGGHYLIEDVKVGYNKDGAIQLEPVRNTTTISEIQGGVGHTVADIPSEGQDQLETATDGGEIESLQGRVMMRFNGAIEPLSVATVSGSLEETPDEVQGAIDYLVLKGRLLKNEAGSYEIP